MKRESLRSPNIEIAVEEVGPPSWDVNDHPPGWYPSNVMARVNVRVVVYGPLPLSNPLCQVLEFHEIRTLGRLGEVVDELAHKYRDWPGPAVVE